MDFLKDAVVGSYQYFRLGSSHSRPGVFLYYNPAAGGEDGCNPSAQLLREEDLPDKKKGSARIIAISDTHARHYGLGSFPEGDVLLHAGDILMSATLRSHSHGLATLTAFNEWMGDIPCDHKVVIAGNHDCSIEKLGQIETQNLLDNCHYLENSQVTVSDLTIWGTPMSTGRSRNRAFQSTEFAAQTMNAFSQLQDPVDIVLSHGPCQQLHKGIVQKGRESRAKYSAEEEPEESFNMHVWGHLHGHYGVEKRKSGVLSVCACIMDGRYDLSNLPVIIDYSSTSTIIK